MTASKPISNLFRVSLYANFETDVLFFGSQALENAMGNRGDFSTLLVSAAFAKLKHLTIDRLELGCKPSFFARYYQPERVLMLGQYTALQMVYLVSEPFNHTTYIGEDGGHVGNGSRNRLLWLINYW
jgi:hypothetical protein